MILVLPDGARLRTTTWRDRRGDAGEFVMRECSHRRRAKYGGSHCTNAWKDDRDDARDRGWHSWANWRYDGLRAFWLCDYHAHCILESFDERTTLGPREDLQ